MAKWCDEGESSVGDVYLREQANPAKWLGLFENATEPAEDATMAAITEQAVGLGYGRIQLAAGDWTEQATKGVFKNVQKIFTAVGGSWGNQYGYFITTAQTGTAGKLLEAELFSDGPYLVNDGWSVKVTPQITIS
jgi:hypothetical protein